MTTFVLVSALLTVLTVVLLTRRLWRKPRRASAASASEPIAAMRQQIEQLAALHQAGVLGEPEFRKASDTLERRMVDAAATAPAVLAHEQPSAPRGLLIVLSSFVCVVAAGGYFLLGNPQALDPVAAQATTSASEHALTPAQIEVMIETLNLRLRERPDDVDGWAVLGRTYAALGRQQEAVPAFKRALTLRPSDATLMTDYADALAVVSGRNLEGEPIKLVTQALEIDPNNLKALALAGMAAFNRKDHAGALRHWEKMAQVDPGSALVQQFQPGIDQARALMGSAAAERAAEQAPTQDALPTAGTSVSGVVTLAASLAGKAAPEDTLFVFARAVNGPRMPLAVLRKQVKDLPLKFSLDDSMAMSPAVRLSSAQSVVVGARVSKRGDATPKAGDLRGVSAPVAPGSSGLKIEISEIVGP